MINTNLLSNNLSQAANTALLQQQLSVVAAQQQQQQQQQHKLHTALSRAVSVPQNSATSAQVVSLMNTLMENLANANTISNSNQLLAAAAAAASSAANSNGHRKLERTQSEPLPQQVNTSR